MSYTRLDVSKRGSIFSAVRTCHTSRSKFTRSSSYANHIAIYLTTVVAYCIQKFNLQLKFTTTFPIHNKNQINIFNKYHSLFIHVLN